MWPFVKLANVVAIAVLFTFPNLSVVPARAQTENAGTDEEALTDTNLRLCQNLQPVHTLKGHLGPITAMATTSDNKTLLTGSSDGSIKIWDLETSELKASFYEHINTIRKIEISPDNQTIFSSDFEETIVWDISTEEVSDRLHGEIKSLIVTPDIEVLVIIAQNSISRDESRIIGWDIKKRKSIYDFKIDTYTPKSTKLNLSTDQTLLVVSGNKLVTIFELATGNIKHRIKIPDEFVDSWFDQWNTDMSSVELHPSNQYLLLNIEARRKRRRNGEQNKQNIVQIWDLGKSPQNPELNPLYWDSNTRHEYLFQFLRFIRIKYA